MIYFGGVDPGLEGAIAWIDERCSRIEIRDVPIAKVEKNKKDYDYVAMGELARELPAGCSVTMELVDSFASDRHWQAFGFGKSFGAWQAALGAAGIRPRLVRPQTWKARMLHGVANSKPAEAKALIARLRGYPIAQQLYGPMGGLRDGRVDAVFLALDGLAGWRLTGRTL